MNIQVEKKRLPSNGPETVGERDRAPLVGKIGLLRSLGRYPQRGGSKIKHHGLTSQGFRKKGEKERNLAERKGETKARPSCSKRGYKRGRGGAPSRDLLEVKKSPLLSGERGLGKARHATKKIGPKGIEFADEGEGGGGDQKVTSTL